MDTARSELRSLLALMPSTATVVVAGASRTMPVEALVPGHRLRLAAGERLATDGIVRSGISSIDVSAITGESIPVVAEPGDAVMAGSINTPGPSRLKRPPPGLTTP